MTQPDKSDTIQHGPPPPDEPGYGSFGTRAVTHDGGRTAGVRIMLKGFELMVDERGESIAYIMLTMGGARQAVQALRQALDDAAARRFR